MSNTFFEIGRTHRVWRVNSNALVTSRGGPSGITFAELDLSERNIGDRLLKVAEAGFGTRTTPVVYNVTCSADESRRTRGLTFIDPDQINNNEPEERQRHAQSENGAGQRDDNLGQAQRRLANAIAEIRIQTGTSLPLVGYDLSKEQALLSTYHPELANDLKRWTNPGTREIVVEISGTGAGAPTLQETLLALGHSSAGEGLCHCGAASAYPTPTAIPALENEQTHQTQPRQENERPIRRRTPFRSWASESQCVARIRVRGKRLDAVVPDATQLFALFPGFRPTAVGVARDGGGEYGWVALQTEDELDRFVDEVCGGELLGEKWSAFMEFDIAPPRAPPPWGRGVGDGGAARIRWFTRPPT